MERQVKYLGTNRDDWHLFAADSDSLARCTKSRVRECVGERPDAADSERPRDCDRIPRFIVVRRPRRPKYRYEDRVLISSHDAFLSSSSLPHPFRFRLDIGRDRHSAA